MGYSREKLIRRCEWIVNMNNTVIFNCYYHCSEILLHMIKSDSLNLLYTAKL